MSEISELLPSYFKWLKTRPRVIRDLAKRLPPNLLYRLKGTGQRATIYSYNENGTLTVSITGQYNLIDFEREVFGIPPEELEECSLPTEDEELGVTQTPEETLQQINLLRAFNGLLPLEEILQS